MNNKSYPETNSNPDFAAIERKILKYWQDNNIFKQSIDNRPAELNGQNNEFIFYDGPPFANGLPHYGHLLTGYKKDMVARYQTMQGKRVERRFGWDCHGLPAEMGAEKDLKISGRAAIIEYGIDKFNEYCRSSVLKYTGEWEEYVTRQARWVDFKDDYKTMDLPYMESVIWAFKELYNKGLIYESMRVMPYSWACETPLSNFETTLDNSYRERTDKAVTFAFTLDKAPREELEKYKCKILAWTTTPWTLPSNLALAIGKDIKYAYVLKGDECLIFAESSINSYRKELGLDKEAELDGYLTSDELVNLIYKPLFPYFAGHANSFKILIGDFVTEGSGTGIVHLAPGFGEDDQILCASHNIQLVCPVDSGGKFTKEISDYAGIQVFEANDEIIKYLKNNSAWIKTEQYIHNYPHCWRTDTPLIYKAVPSWYVEVTKFRDRMVANNQQINWIPSHIKDGRFGKWLENARDWSISRNRFWGTPIPIWKSDDDNYPRIEVYGSIKELEEAFGVKVTDLHKPYIDDLIRPNPDDPTGKSMMRRIDDVFDCWFESGSMPFAQVHYPFENKEWFESHLPADFIAEYVAQTRGWFYTLMVLSTALFDKPPFLNCVCHGVILDEKGQKLSKRLNNYADPKVLFEQYSSDALRWLMLSSTVMRGQEFLIDKEGKMIKDVLRLVIKPIWNAYNFFTLYANSDQVRAKFVTSSSNLIDKYILSKAKDVTEKFAIAMSAYDTVSACTYIESFFEIFNNWYIRRNRTRFWKKEKDQDKQEAYDTMFTILDIMCKLIAPLLPMLSEEIYLGINNDNANVTSVHLVDYPNNLEIEYDENLVSDMDAVRDICSTSLSIRNDENIRVRLPLASLEIVTSNNNGLASYEDIIRDEVNVKQVVFSSDISGKANHKLQINFPILGKRLPAKMKDIIVAVKNNNWKINPSKQIEIVGEILLPDEGNLLLEAVNSVNTRSLNSNEGLVILDLNITNELAAEGTARDIVRIVQQMRKDADLNVSDNIDLFIISSDFITNIVKLHSEYISEQTLSSINYEKPSKFDAEYKGDFDSIETIIMLNKK